jgi:hypothetical protein
MNNPVRPSFPRRFFRWLLSWRNARRALIAAACLVTFIVAVFVVEGWRGRRAWAEVNELARSRGEVLSIAPLVPPPVPADENFAAAPVIAALFSSDANIAQAAAERWTLPQPADGKKEPGFGLQKDPGVSVLDAWRAYLGTDDVLASLDRYAADIDEISAAALRPHARFPIRYEDGFAASLPHVGPIQKISRIIRLRAEARLERGLEPGLAREAAGDLATLLRLARLVNEEPTLISQLVARSIVVQAMPLVGAGLATGAWSDADLALLEVELARLDLVRSGWRSLRGELAGVSTIFMQFVREPEVIGTAVAMVGSAPSVASRVVPQCIPSGWIYQNATRVAHLYLDEILPAYDEKSRRVDFARLQALDERMRTNRGRSPYRVLADMLMPAMQNLGANFAAGQTQVDFARIAIELERWKNTHGTYPQTLAELPATVAGLRDYATGEALRYRRNDDGTYLLYATGADAVDDGGSAPKGSGSNAHETKGDWVWLPR